MAATLSSLRSGVAAFAPRARLLKLIGAELISDDVVAITELVKNAHDADATQVCIQFIGVAGAHGEIFVRDDGHGMDVDTLLTRWMQPAGSGKGRDGTRHTPGGRRVLGEKGVGRFAADKLAAELELVSRCQDATTELRAVFDWDQFEADEKMLADVGSHWEVRPPDWLDGHGTVLRLSQLRSPWTERMFKRLCSRLTRLVSPFGPRHSFRILIESDEFPRYAGEVAGGLLDAAPYRIEAEFDGVSTIRHRLGTGRTVEHQWSGGERLACGPVRARLFAFDLETEAIARVGPRNEVRAWLREWSGVSVYRDGYRIWPYGEPHDDWLRLDQRRVNNPVVRLSNNQVVGFVEVSADKNPSLRDQTSREGLIHNEALGDLQRFVVFALQLLEAERQAHRHPASSMSSTRGSTASTEADLSGLPTSLDRIADKAPLALAGDLRRVAQRARSQIGSQSQLQDRMLQGYTELAAMGHSSTLLGRSLAIQADILAGTVDALRRAAVGVPVASLGLAATLDRLTSMAETIKQDVGALAAGEGASYKRRRIIDIASELAVVRRLLWPLLAQEGADIIVEAEAGSLLRTDMRPEAFSAVICALVRNSLDWRDPSRPLRITAAVRNDADAVEMLFTDTGAGVRRGLEQSLFDPMVSGKDEGYGMGLTLARNILASHGGSISLVIDRRRRGAAFRLRFPRKRSRATTVRD